MRISDIYIANYKILQDFSIKKNDEAVSVFIGINGSGKSSLLEAVALIFSQTYQYYIDGNKSIDPFSDFSITYHIWPTTVVEEDAVSQETRTDYLIVTISSSTKLKEKFKILIDGNIPEAKKGVDIKEVLRKLLPANVIIYYAGLNDTMQNLCSTHEQSFSKQLRENKVEGLRPLFYFRPQHFKPLLLSLLSFEYGNVPTYINEYLKIESLVSFEIKIKKPIWGKGKSEKFWGADGAVSTFLTLMKENSVNTLFEQDKVVFQFEGIASLYSMRDYYGEERKFFQMLDIALFDDLLDSIDITLRKDGVEIKAENLSEGEQQFLIIKCLNELLISPFTLLLFDEPDTFLHPKLQTQFISELVEYSYNACYYITTHSSILVSNLQKGNLYSMIRGRVKQIEGHFYGRAYGDNLEDIMDTMPRNEEAQKLLNEIFDLIDSQDKKKLAQAKDKIKEFEILYGNDDSEILRANSLMSFFED